MKNDDDMLGLIHTKCDGLAFWYKADEAFPRILVAEDIMYPNGTRPSPHQIPVCQSCGAALLDTRRQLSLHRRAKS